ncbi:uncharacterized protein LOC124494892 [Dermatophagoides farinae]|uniref:Gamma-aminobutyric acid receptor-associated protein-like 2 n=1 Tax=Dermatophagoides farinae TaxID=6954 RepID=A0A922L0V9_DERFA|nr:Gamma-aminobutyric acid receptor-associated protein-like 2 [Dermatophagoides farinae]
MSWRHSTTLHSMEKNHTITTIENTGISNNNDNNDNSKEFPLLSSPISSSDEFYKQRRQQQLCRNILHRFPGRVPVIVEKLETTPKNFIIKPNSKKNLGSIMNFNKKNKIYSPLKTTTTTTTMMKDKKRYKFLVPYDCTVGQFQWILRDKIDVMASSNRAIYLIVNRTLPHASCLIGELYRQYQDNDDGYLYIRYSDENTFGSSSSSSSTPLMQSQSQSSSSSSTWTLIFAFFTTLCQKLL